MRAAIRAYGAELPGALLLATLTAVVTLLLLVVLSALFGGANEEHRLETRCYNAQVVGLLREIIENAPTLSEAVDLDDFPAVNTEGLDCSFFEEPPEEE